MYPCSYRKSWFSAHYIKTSCEHANYVQDGGSLMTPSSHFEFVVRTLLQIVLFFLLQLPKSYQVQVDKDRFLSAFSMVENGTRTPVTSWPLGPGLPCMNLQNCLLNMKMVLILVP